MATVRKLYPDRKGKLDKGLHIEAEGCIVNIRENLTDRYGRSVTSIEVIPDNYSGELPWKRVGLANTRVIQLKHMKKRK